MSTTIPLYPTLFIGLGGSGAKTLHALRRLFLTQRGQTGPPWVRYLLLDLDPATQWDSSSGLLGPELAWQPDEFLLLDLNGLRGLIENAGMAGPAFAWLDPQVGFRVGPNDPLPYCRQIARLAFQAQLPHIQMSVRRCLMELSCAGLTRRMQCPLEEGGEECPDFDPQLVDIVLVHSLAGSMGSACFLDLAFLCRNLEQDLNGLAVRLHDYAFLPSLFSYGDPRENPARRQGAHAVAALLELLGHARLSGAGLQAIQPGRETSRARARHPFSTFWLLGNSTERCPPLPPGRRSLFDMLAWRLFHLQGHSELSRRMRHQVSWHANRPIDHELLSITSEQDEVYAQLSPRLFKSFGLSRLCLPDPEIRLACALQLSLDLIAHWLREPQAPLDETRRGREDLLDELGLTWPRLRDLLLVAPDRHSLLRDVDASLSACLDEWCRALDSPEKRGISQRIQHDLTRLQHLLDYTPSQDPQRMGDLAVHVCHYAPAQVSAQLKGHLEGKVREWLENPQQGLSWTCRALALVAEALEQDLAQELSVRRQRLQTASADLQGQVDRLLRFIQDEESSFFFQRSAMRVLCRTLASRLSERLTCDLQLLALEQAQLLLRQMAEELGRRATSQVNGWGSGNQGRLQIHHDRLWSIQENLRKELSHLEAADQEYRVERQLCPPSDFRAWYRLPVEGTSDYRPVEGEDLRRLEADLLQTLEQRGELGRKGRAGFACLFENLESIERRSFQDTLIHLSLQRFLAVRNPLELDLLPVLNRLDLQERQRGAREVHGWSEAWLRGDPASLRGVTRIHLLAGHASLAEDPDFPFLAQELCGGKFSPDCLQVGTREDRSSLWRQVELSGFSAQAVVELRTCWRAYEEERILGVGLHLTRDVHRLPPLLFQPYVGLMEQRSAAETLLAAVVTGGVRLESKPNEQEGCHVVLSFFDERENPRKGTWLGIWQDALRRLAENPALHQHLKEVGERRLTEMTQAERGRCLRALYKTALANELFQPLEPPPISAGVTWHTPSSAAIRALLTRCLELQGWTQVHLQACLEDSGEDGMAGLTRLCCDDGEWILPATD